jgi:hypothetical protein
MLRYLYSLLVVDVALPALLAGASWDVLGYLTPAPRVAVLRNNLQEDQQQQPRQDQYALLKAARCNVEEAEWFGCWLLAPAAICCSQRCCKFCEQ